MSEFIGLFEMRINVNVKVSFPMYEYVAVCFELACSVCIPENLG